MKTAGMMEKKGSTLSPNGWRTMIRTAGLVIVAGVILAICGQPMLAQVTTAEVVGTVTDATGAILPGAEVTLKSLDTNATQKATANSAGDYAFNLLPIGRYTVTVSMPSFRVFKVSEFALAAGDHTRLNATLTIGSATETVEVTSQTSGAQTDSSTVGSLLDTKSVQDLPLNGRNYVNLVTLTPGVTSGTGAGGLGLSSGTRPDDRRQSSAYSANGQDPSANNNLIDGVDNNDRLIGTIGVRPSIDAISEVKIQTNLYTADIGRTSGGVVNILTKSGTNNFHGTAFEFFLIDLFDAHPFYNFTGATSIPRKPKFRQNQFGGSLGGPIFKDKTFFFGDYEGLRIVQGGTTTGIVVPTALQRVGNLSEACTSTGATFNAAGLCSDPSRQISLTAAVGSAPAGVVPFNRLDLAPYAASLDPIGLKLASLYPFPNAGSGVTAANYNATGNKTYFGHTFDGKIDHHFNDRNTLRGRYSFNQVSVLVPTLFPNVAAGYNPGSGTTGVGGTFPGTNRTRAQNLLLNYTRVIKPNLLLDLNASYLRDYINSQNINYGKNVSSTLGIPGVNLADPQTGGLVSLSTQGFQSLGDASFTPLLEIDNSYEYKGAVVWSKGRHNVKVGGGFIRRQFSIQQSTGARGTFTFNGSAASAAAPVENGVYNPAAPNTPSTGNNDGAGLANLLLGSPVTLSRSLSPFVSSYRTWEPNIYVQDDWRATRWLTLNLGLRYDMFTPKTEIRDRISNLNIATGQVLYPGFNTNRTTGIQTAGTNVSPRIGFAATVGKDLVVRGGYGISFFPGDINSGALLKNPPFTPSQSCGPTTTTPCSAYGAYGTLDQGFFVPSVNFSTTNLASGLPTISIPSGSGFTEIDQNFRPSYMQQYNLLLEKGFGKNVASVGYVGTTGSNIVMNPQDINRALPSGTSTPNPRPISVLNPNLGAVQAFVSAGVSHYNALEVSFQRRLSNGLSGNAGYTYSHETDDATGLAGTGSSGYGNAIGSPSTYIQNIRTFDYGTGDFNIGNRGFVAVNYELPKAKVNHVLGQAVNGWQVNGTAIWQSGLPYTVTDASTVSGIIGLTSGERANRLLKDLALPAQTSTPQGLAYVNPAAFAVPSAYTLGNEGRNVGVGPRSSFINTSFFKTFFLWRETNLQFRTEIFNLPNHRVFGQPVVNTFAAGSTTFGKITAVSSADAPRQIQFALKLQF